MHGTSGSRLEGARSRYATHFYEVKRQSADDAVATLQREPAKQVATTAP
jgi:hypothetical protein